MRSRTLRREMSASEKVLWEHLRKRRTGYRFNRQVPVGPYFLDFYCAEAGVCVEVDGEQHMNRLDKDLHRDGYLSGKGIYTLRIPSLDLFEATGLETGRWVRKIRQVCEERAAGLPHPQPPPHPVLRRDEEGAL
ncbi:MAG TPA: DUF559 domain-containing protein [Fimbriimonas sp.]